MNRITPEKQIEKVLIRALFDTVVENLIFDVVYPNGTQKIIVYGDFNSVSFTITKDKALKAENDIKMGREKIVDAIELYLVTGSIISMAPAMCRDVAYEIAEIVDLVDGDKNA